MTGLMIFESSCDVSSQVLMYMTPISLKHLWISSTLDSIQTTNCTNKVAHDVLDHFSLEHAFSSKSNQSHKGIVLFK